MKRSKVKIKIDVRVISSDTYTRYENLFEYVTCGATRNNPWTGVFRYIGGDSFVSGLFYGDLCVVN